MAITKLVITGNTTAVGISSTPITVAVVNPASTVTVNPNDNITATNVQDALEQLDDIKAPINNPIFQGDLITTGHVEVLGKIYADKLQSTYSDVIIQSTDTSGKVEIKGTDAFDNTNTNFIAEGRSAVMKGNNIAQIRVNPISVNFVGILQATDLWLSNFLKVTGDAELNGGDLILRSDSTDADTQYIRFENHPSDIRTAYIRADYSSETAGGGTALAFGANDHDTATDTDSMVIDIEGNVGIGTSSPASRLAIHGAADVAHIVQTNTANSQKLEIGNAYSLYTGASGAVSAIASDSTLAFATNDTERMRINPSGNVGIGTIPDVKLDVTEAYDTVANVLSNGSYAAKFSSSGSGDTGRTQGILLSGQAANSRGVALLAEAQSTNNAHDFVIATSAASSTPTERMRITSSGVVHVHNGIDFGGAVNSGGTVSSSNTLDDYEEGTWTPNLVGATSGSASFTNSQATYTKVGNQVYLQAYLTNILGVSHNAVGELRIGQLPFTVSKLGLVNVSHCNAFDFNEATNTISGYVSSGNYISLRKGSSKTSVDGSELTNSNTVSMIVHAVYTTNS